MKAGLMLGVNPDAEREENDFYATDPYVIDKSFDFFKQIGLSNKLWEPACGMGHLSERLKLYNYDVFSTDLVDYGYKDFHKQNFLFPGSVLLNDEKTLQETILSNREIITNPPFKLASEFIYRANELAHIGQKSLFFMKIQFLETEKRKQLFKDCGLRYVGVMSTRICCAKNGEFEKYFSRDKVTGAYKGGTQLYAWYVFEKGYAGNPEILFI